MDKWIRFDEILSDPNEFSRADSLVPPEEVPQIALDN